MANQFPDHVGRVDVISDAENIKKLLAIPYADTHISMVVHRSAQMSKTCKLLINFSVLRVTHANYIAISTTF